MRLIDADALHRSFEEVYEHPVSMFRDSAWWFFGKLEDEPTVDAAPVVHGRWIVHPDDWRFILVCSNCGRMMPDYRTGKPPYCTCGAKMDLQEDSE